MRYRPDASIPTIGPVGPCSPVGRTVPVERFGADGTARYRSQVAPARSASVPCSRCGEPVDRNREVGGLTSDGPRPGPVLTPRCVLTGYIVIRSRSPTLDAIGPPPGGPFASGPRPELRPG